MSKEYCRSAVFREMIDGTRSDVREALEQVFDRPPPWVISLTLLFLFAVFLTAVVPYWMSGDGIFDLDKTEGW